MNRKRGRSLLEFESSKKILDEQHLKNIEKIILKRTKPADYFIEIYSKSGWIRTEMHSYSSIRYIPNLKETLKRVIKIEIRSFAPNIVIDIKKNSSVVKAQRMYDKDEDLKVVKEIFNQLCIYIENIS